MLALAQVSCPAKHELRFGRAPLEQGGTDIEQDRAIGPQTYTRTEGVARGRRRLLEPIVEHLRSDHHSSRIDLVQIDDLTLLNLVPHNDLLRRKVSSPLLDRWSQLATANTLRMPSSSAARA